MEELSYFVATALTPPEYFNETMRIWWSIFAMMTVFGTFAIVIVYTFIMYDSDSEVIEKLKQKYKNNPITTSLGLIAPVIILAGLWGSWITGLVILIITLGHRRIYHLMIPKEERK